MTQGEKNIRNYLQATAKAWGGHAVSEYNSLILEKGEIFVGRKLAKEFPHAKEFKKRRKPKMKECFYNSQMFVMYCPQYKYYEGYCDESIIPYQHAWVVIEGHVVDFTAEARDVYTKKHLHKVEYQEPVYLGVHVPSKNVLELLVENEATEPLAHRFHLNSKVRFV